MGVEIAAAGGRSKGGGRARNGKPRACERQGRPPKVSSPTVRSRGACHFALCHFRAMRLHRLPPRPLRYPPRRASPGAAPMLVLPQSTERHPVRALAFSPDGLTLACAGRRDFGVALWDLVARESRVVIGTPKGTITSVAFSPDGGLLAFATSGGALEVWSLKKQRGTLVR